MAFWKMISVAVKAQQTWKRLPQSQRQKLLQEVGKSVRTHGPSLAKGVAKAVGTAAQEAARKRRR